MDYKSVIESKYNRENWQALLHDIFGNKVKFYTYTTEIEVNKDIARKALYLGKISLTDGKTIGVYEVELNDSVHIESNKVAIRNLLTSDWRMNGFAGAFMFCFKKDESILRFSYVSEVWGFNEDGKYEKQSTNTKRFTYLLGEGHGGRTAIDQFKSLKSSALTLDDITKAFSVDVLTKQFYNDLFNWYLWAIDPESNVTFPGDTSTPDDDREDLETKIIRMITRIMFVWFIKQKQLVPDKIFDIEYLCTILKDFDALSTTKGEYYNAILQNLFFATLNRAIIDEDGSTRQFSHAAGKDVKNKYRYAELFSVSEQEVIDIFSTVPFVNGGLFECLDKTKTLDGVDKAFYYDGFSRNDNKFANGRFRNRAFVPNVLFFEPEKGLFSILKRYNFTIEENSPEEQQVALDPELLGKVFENLLGAYNPETQESARNSSGSFYTPREIVNYMVDESLVQYLGDTPVVRSLFADEFTPDEVQRDAYKDIARRLKTIKILDPACGSGAFPMGALKRIVEVLKRIDPEESDYELKLSIIENCIYGSDIQCIAAQITKLRFFISLICECDRDESKPNFGIPVLPNLETKFVAANSLLALKRREAVQLNVFDDTPRLIVELRAKLTEVRHQHFMAKSASTKRRLRDRDAQLRQELSELLSTGHAIDANDAQQLASWNPYDQNAVATFFDPEWMFGIANGFDIVIGNPPYISTKGVTTEDKKKYEKEFGFSDDTYNLFTVKGIDLLKAGGTLSYIIPKTFWTTQTKRNMRDLILSNQINYIYDAANPFDAVMVDTCIINVSKVPMPVGHEINFLDGTKDLIHPFVFAPIRQSIYINTQNSVIFKPTELNLRIYELYGERVKKLYDEWWNKIETSKKISKNQAALEAYRAALKPGDIALLGCLTEGGQGLATANNGKYIAVRRSTKWARNIIESRPKKLAEAITKKRIVLPQMAGFANTKAFLDTLSEREIADLFDSLKEQYGRDIFGQGYLYKIIEDNEVANVDELTQDEKENGIDSSKNYYVPYDKGDKDGNRWYLETPFAIAWSKENVRFLKTDPKARYQGYTFYFRERFVC